jgi:hypothetical protein
MSTYAGDCGWLLTRFATATEISVSVVAAVNA